MVLARSLHAVHGMRARGAGVRVASLLMLMGTLIVPRAHAMAVPDSGGFARLEETAGASGHARLRMLWRQDWYTIRKAGYDSSGVHAGVRERDTKGMTAVWSEPAAQGDIPWSEVERLQVPTGRDGLSAPVVGAALGGLLSLTVLAYQSLGEPVGVKDALRTATVMTVGGACYGAIFSAINPFRKPRWREF